MPTLRTYGDEAKGGDGLRLALGRDRINLLGGDCLCDEAKRRLAEQDLTGVRVLLQSGGDIDRIACHECLSRARVSGDHFAGVHADPQRQPGAVAPLEVLV